VGIFFTKVEEQPTHFNRNSFLIALGLLILFLAVALCVDIFNWADDSSAYTGLVGTVLGAVLGFIGGEASGTASGK
jgi:hypothetical protein